MSGKWGYSHILIPERARGLESGLGTRTRCLGLISSNGTKLDMKNSTSSSLHHCETSWAAGIATHGEDFSPSVFSFMPPVVRTKVSNRSKGCTFSIWFPDLQHCFGWSFFVRHRLHSVCSCFHPESAVCGSHSRSF